LRTIRRRRTTSANSISASVGSAADLDASAHAVTVHPSLLHDAFGFSELGAAVDAFAAD
jgi:hypothetical protein